MATQQDVFKELQNIKDAIVKKGGKVTIKNSNISLPELVTGVNTIPTVPTGGTGDTANAIIKAAELPNTTLTLTTPDGGLLYEFSTGENGGVVEFPIWSLGDYIVFAKDSNDNVNWTNTVKVNNIGIYECKVGKPLEEYSWEEISIAANGGYAKYMWSAGDAKNLPVFMNSIDEAQTRTMILGFDHDELVDGGKAGITFYITRTVGEIQKSIAPSSIIDSWTSMPIRRGCSKKGDKTYYYDNTVSASTAGDYYVYDNISESFRPVFLPDDFVEGEKYYVMYEAEEDGKYISGFPQGVLPFVKKVKKKTWTGFRTISVPGDLNATITTEDYLFLLSDAEVFGAKGRRMITSRLELEGEQYEVFKHYKETTFRYTTSVPSTSILSGVWLRSPHVTSGSYFVSLYSLGAVGSLQTNSSTTSTSTNGYTFLAFCL